METHRVPGKAGRAFTLGAGQTFDVIDVEGQQAADLVAFTRGQIAERFSPKYTMIGHNRLHLEPGDELVTTEGRPILTVLEDDCGRHDMLYPPCSEWLIEGKHGIAGVNGCRENLAEALAPAGVGLEHLGETLNLFMQTDVHDGERIEIGTSPSDAGDRVRFRTEQDTTIGVASCTSSILQAGEEKPIDLRLPPSASFL